MTVRLPGNCYQLIRVSGLHISLRQHIDCRKQSSLAPANISTLSSLSIKLLAILTLLCNHWNTLNRNVDFFSMQNTILHRVGVSDLFIDQGLPATDVRAASVNLPLVERLAACLFFLTGHWSRVIQIPLHVSLSAPSWCVQWPPAIYACPLIRCEIPRQWRKVGYSHVLTEAPHEEGVKDAM